MEHASLSTAGHRSYVSFSIRPLHHVSTQGSILKTLHCGGLLADSTSTPPSGFPGPLQSPIDKNSWWLFTAANQSEQVVPCTFLRAQAFILLRPRASLWPHIDSARIFICFKHVFASVLPLHSRNEGGTSHCPTSSLRVVFKRHYSPATQQH